MRKMLEDNIHINKLLYSLNNKNKMEYLIKKFTNYNNNYNSLSLANSTKHSHSVPNMKKNKSKYNFLILNFYFIRCRFNWLYE